MERDTRSKINLEPKKKEPGIQGITNKRKHLEKGSKRIIIIVKADEKKRKATFPPPLSPAKITKVFGPIFLRKKRYKFRFYPPFCINTLKFAVAYVLQTPKLNLK